MLASIPKCGSFDLSSRDPQGRGDLPFQPLSDQDKISESDVSPDQTASLTPDQALKLRVVDPACGEYVIIMPKEKTQQSKGFQSFHKVRNPKIGVKDQRLDTFHIGIS